MGGSLRERFAALRVVLIELVFGYDARNFCICGVQVCLGSGAWGVGVIVFMPCSLFLRCV